MKTQISIITIFCIIACVFFAGCGIESQESTFRYRLQSMDELAAKATGDLKANIITEKALFEEKYKKLPVDVEPRGEALGRLNQDSRTFINTMTKKLDDIAAAADAKRRKDEKAEFGTMLAKLAGNWYGAGMRLLISSDGTIEYERLAGGVKKTISGGTITRIGMDSFDVKVLVGSTTFKIDNFPHRDGADWKMKVDGVDLTRKQ